MGDNGFRDFAKATFLPTFGEKAKETAAIAVGDLAKNADAYFAHFGGDESKPTCRHQWLRPDNGWIECAVCGVTREDHGDAL